MKYVALVGIAGLVAASLFLPEPPPPVPADAPSPEQASFAVCPIQEGGGLTTQVTAASTGEGSVQLTLFAAGAPVGSIGVSIGEAGANVIPVVDVAAVGTVGGLVELPSAFSAAGSVTRGVTSTSAEACGTATPTQIFLTGGATADQRTFEVHLMNPFAGEAVVDLVVSSEVGIESNDRLNSVIVPAMSSSVLDLSEIVPGRERMTVRVDTSRGRVYVVGRQSGEADNATWNGVAGASDWLVPVPSGDIPSRVLVGNPSDLEVDYQIDVYSPLGLEEAVVSGTLSPGEQAVVDLTGLVEATVQGIRVVAADAVVATLWVEGGPMLSATTGATGASSRWLLPGSMAPDVESGRVVVLNPGLEDVNVSIRSLRSPVVEHTLLVQAESVVEVALDATDGFLVEATGPVVALSALVGQGPGAMSIGVPLNDE